jgi:hypothetical protein
MALSPQFQKKYLEIQKKPHIFALVEVTIIINPLKLILLCRNLLSQLKTKTPVVMLFRLILSILSMVLEIILSEYLRWVLLLLWIRLKRKMTLLSLLKKNRVLLNLILKVKSDEK